MTGTGTTSEEISHEKEVCEEHRQPYRCTRALGKTGLKEENMSKTAPEYLFGSPVDSTKEIRIAPEANNFQTLASPNTRKGIACSPARKNY